MRNIICYWLLTTDYWVLGYLLVTGYRLLGTRVLTGWLGIYPMQLYKIATLASLDAGLSEVTLYSII